MIATPTHRTPGRPKDLDKRAAILTTAMRLFLGRGYEGVTMEAAAAAAGVSKMTVYSHFHDKSALFRAVVEYNTDQMLAELTNLDGAGTKPDLETALVASGLAMLRLIFNPACVAMSHMLMGMLMQDHGLAEAFYDAGPGRMRKAIAAFLTEIAETEGLMFDSAQSAADDLVSLWEGDMQKQLALGLIPPLTEADIDRRVRRGVAVFLRAYRV